MPTERDTDWRMEMDYLLNINKKRKRFKIMPIKIETVSGKVYNLSVTTLGKKVGRFFKSIVKKAVDFTKDLVKTGISYLHTKLSQLEDYLLEKVSDFGAWAEEKITERIEEPIDEVIPE